MKNFVIVIIILIALSVFHGVASADSEIIFNPANKHYYQRFDIESSWYDAKAYCENLRGHLATITSQEENDFVLNNVLHIAYGCFIGGTDENVEGVWEWITGEAWNYSNWAPGEPNDKNGEDYLMMINVRGRWNDLKNTASTYFICEWGFNPELPSPLYVDLNGVCNGNSPCYTSIQEAIDNATAGSTIKIIAGTYDEDLWVSSSGKLTLEGGWNNDFTDRSSDTLVNSLTITDDGQIIVDRLTIISDEIPTTTTTTTTTTSTTTSTTSSSTTTTIQEYEFDGTWSGKAISTTPKDKYGNPCGYANFTMFINRGIITGTAVSYPWGGTYTLSGIVASDGTMVWGMAVGNTGSVASGTGSLSSTTGSGNWQDVYECSGPWNATKQY